MKKFIGEKTENVKKSWKSFVSKTYMAGAAVTLAMTPTVAGAAAPSTYVNKISDKLFGEILKVAPKVVLVVMGWALLMYFVSGDDHKKNKWKGVAGIALIGYLVLLVLKPLVSWVDGII
jgi:RsiW-degrading membrane proteinase PrsW (M82 family)